MYTLLLKTIKKLKTNIKFIIIFSLIYLTGLILGIVFSNKNLCNDYLYNNLCNYYYLIFDVTVNVFKPFINSILTGILLTLALTIFGFNIITTYLFSIVIFYRGLVLGTSLILFYSLSSISGVIIFITITLPTNLTTTTGLIVGNTLNYDAQNTCNFNLKYKKIASNALISILFTLASSLYFLFLTITVIRPINLLF